MTNESDRELIERIRARNDQQAWNELDRRYRGRLMAYVHQYIGTKNNDAEDIVQDTFLGFQNSLPNFDPSRPLETWLFTIARNKTNDYLRRRKRLPPHFHLLQDSDDSSQDIEVVDPKQRKPSSQVRSAEQREKEAFLLADRLSEYVRTLMQNGHYDRLKALELVFVLGWPNKDAAHYLKVTDQDIANWVYQAKQWLSKKLKNVDGISELREG